MEGAFLPVPDPVAFKVFGLDIRWYGILVVTGMICAVLLSQKRAPRYGIDP
ncbi:MAG: prolipoprotein diacylglyceryl transferase, partial [Clostridia bacterium]|nr:prolipoprotein diacylglyceryl transferase [Clostridia bacterium]